MMLWLLLATGFTGAFTLQFLCRMLAQLFVAPPALDVCITDGAECLGGLLAALKRARREILVLARSFSARPVAQALVDARLRGVHVEILLDPACERDRASDLSFLLEQGMQPLVTAPNTISVGAMLIIDGRTVYTGSFSSSPELSEDTAVELLCIKGYPEVAAAYRQHFTNEKSDARPAENKLEASPSPASRLSSLPPSSLPASPQRFPSSPTLPPVLAESPLPAAPSSAPAPSTALAEPGVRKVA